MRSKFLLILTSVIFLFYLVILPKPAQGAYFSLIEDLPSAAFPNVSITGEVQTISGGNGNIAVRGLLGGLLWEDWSVSVQATPFTNTLSGSTLTLPPGSLQLTAPNSSITGCNRYEGSPWLIDDGVPKNIVYGRFALLGLGSCTYTFAAAPFILTIYPYVKMIDPGQTSATYQATVTWTIISTGGI